jgi:hypothetical protein
MILPPMNREDCRPRCGASPRRSLRAASILIVVATASLVAAAAPAQAPPKPAPAPHTWLDPTGAPLPIQTQPEILEYLRTAEVVDRSPIGRGVAGTERLVLDRDGVRLRAAFRTVDESYRGPFQGMPTSVRRIRDAATSECAAYELSQALGFGRVPPTVCRKVGDKDGSVQIWLEGAMTQDDFLEKSSDPPDVEEWNLQKYNIYVFDQLIANTDRNQGNILVGREGTLWCIDHTRAFAQTSRLLDADRVTRCSRDLWLALEGLDEKAVEKRVEPFLKKGEIKALFKRREELVEHIEKLIAEQGEEAVLFDLDPPPAP